jgi:hypothetical protein
MQFEAAQSGVVTCKWPTVYKTNTDGSIKITCMCGEGFRIKKTRLECNLRKCPIGINQSLAQELIQAKVFTEGAPINVPVCYLCKAATLICPKLNKTGTNEFSANQLSWQCGCKDGVTYTPVTVSQSSLTKPNPEYSTNVNVESLATMRISSNANALTVSSAMDLSSFQ